MTETTATKRVTFRYWAGAKAAAGTESEEVPASSVEEALQTVLRRRPNPHFARVIRASALLVDGRTAHREDLERPLDGPVTVEVLPPFAGG